MFQTGGLKDPLFFIGIVEEIDKGTPGRVRVRAFGVHGTNDKIKTKHLPWALCVSGSYDPNVFMGNLLNKFVFGCFTDGRDAQHPIVLGLLPTQFAPSDPNFPINLGYGVIPDKHGDLESRGTSPDDWGKPQQSSLARGEELDETYILVQEMNRVEDIKIAGQDDATWSEPPPAYNAVWPNNRVMETKHHIIELDDTPTAERIMIYHKEGSFVQMDAAGNVTHKAAGEKYDVTIKNSHVFTGGQCHVHVGGNATMYVHGDLTTEVNQNYKLNVGGSAEISVGGQLAINASDQLTMRSAEVRMFSNVSNMSIVSKKNLKIQAGESLNTIAPYTKQSSLLSHNIQAGPEGYNLLVTGDYLASVNNFFVDALGTVPTSFGSLGVEINSLVGPAKLQSTTYTTIYGGVLVEVDNLVNLAGRLRGPTFVAGAVGSALDNIDFAQPGALPKMPEPKGKSTSVYLSYGSGSSAGVTTGAGHNPSLTDNRAADIVTDKISVVKPILDTINLAESARDGYEAIHSKVPQRDRPSKPLSSMTVQEVLDWQSRLIATGRVGLGREYPSVAAGKYQFINETLQRMVDKGYANPNDLFNEQTQDNLAVGLMTEDGGLDSWLNGTMSNNQFGNRLAGIWAGLPNLSGALKGKSTYGGDGENSARISEGTLIAAIGNTRSRWNEFNSTISSVEDAIDKHIAVNIPDIFKGLG
jgi:muramidase (phage lysozyme)